MKTLKNKFSVTILPVLTAALTGTGPELMAQHTAVKNPGTLSSKAMASAQRKSSVVNWKVSPFDHKIFIENRGQYDADVKGWENVLFKADMGGVRVFFTSHGIVYRYDKPSKKPEEPKKKSSNDREMEEKEEIERLVRNPPEIHYVKAEWIGSNPDVSIEAQEEQKDYYTFAAANGTTIKAHAFKKITYRNLYPGIDLEYVFPKDKEGIKYSFLIHPGADASQIKIKYNGLQKLSLDQEGNVLLSMIEPPVADITDHAPQTFYSDSKEPVASSFSLTRNIVSFKINGYDTSKEITIDPWMISTGLNEDWVFDVAKDLAGNVYIYGGSNGIGSALMPWQVRKFNSSGTALWTFITDTVWGKNMYGDLAVDPTGNSYITSGISTPGAGIQKIDPGGTLVWNVTYGGSPSTGRWNEFWNLTFDCSYTKLYIVNGYNDPATTIPENSVSYLDPATGAVTGGQTVDPVYEPRAMTWAPNGNLYLLSCLTGNVIGIDTSSFATIFSQPHGYGYGFFGGNGLDYSGPHYIHSGSNGVFAAGVRSLNAIAAGNSFVATSDGATLKKWNLTTGASMASVAIPGGVEGGMEMTTGTEYHGNSGIIVDQCNNIYAGSQKAVYVFDPSLNVIDSVVTTGTVYCLYNGDNGQVLACGDGFVASFYFPLANSVSITKTSTPSACGSCNGTAKATLNLCGGADTTNVTYSWSNGQTTQTATGLCAGTYTISMVATGGCSPATYSDTINISGGSANPTITGITAICKGGSTMLTASPGGTYLWNNGATTQNITANPTSTTIYTVTVTYAGGCTATATATVTVTSPPVAAITGNNSICAGASAQLTASGGGNYLWSTGSTVSSITVMPSATTTYSVVVSNGACKDTAAYAVTVIPKPAASAQGSITIDIGSSTTLTATGGGTYSWIPATGLSCTNCSSPVASPTVTTDYCVFVTNANGCSDSACVRIAVDIHCNELFIPDAFSPNDDNINDNLCVYGNCIQTMTLAIFDRWGEKVFESTDPQKCWDGFFRGKKMDPGIFAYYFQATMMDGKKTDKKGNILLMR